MVIHTSLARRPSGNRKYPGQRYFPRSRNGDLFARYRPGTYSNDGTHHTPVCATPPHEQAEPTQTTQRKHVECGMRYYPSARGLLLDLVTCPLRLVLTLVGVPSANAKAGRRTHTTRRLPPPNPLSPRRSSLLDCASVTRTLYFKSRGVTNGV
ncbi:hypothetical protein K505DRAFT_37269 [Melanomma pulvis-pyrius CBS 109.77]|uniref:Uncharacterized protein n=1 Tax=Melanomma pulvis-pyrius CBS 109.77 TaxID=1314802 RepID=A0A6A6XBQ7_9PLEO|nr:hypothetical protein K505DRAFT_37269 [Melanomma pulvis-pyrius CBS 109.77]